MNIDRRAKTRHDVQLICHIGSGRVLSRPVSGVVENISRGGILMRWEKTIPVPESGSSLVVEVALPENSEFGSRVMRCRTTVIRVTNRPGRRATIALRIEQIRFVQLSEARKESITAITPAYRMVN